MAEVITGNRSHWLELPRAHSDCPFDKEELHPIVRVTVPRVGTVRAEMSADRYVASYYDEATNTSTNRMGDWRIVLRSVREDRDYSPQDGYPHEVSGVGPKTREAIRDAAVPVVREWLETSEYARSRRRAATAAIVREVKDAAGRGSYAFDRVRQYLDAASAYMAPPDVSTLKTAIERMSAALETVERLGKDD